MYEYHAVARRTIDGDTVELDLDLGLFIHRYESCRLYGIDAPEKQTPTYEAGVASRNRLAELVMGHPLVVHTHKDRDKYGRFLATLYRADAAPWEWNYSINVRMVTEGFAIFRSY